MSDDEHFGRLGKRHDQPSTPWSTGAKHVQMTTVAWMIYHSAWIVCNKNDCMSIDYIDLAHLDCASRYIVFG